jgi:Domain of unknown function (DUF6916)
MTIEELNSRIFTECLNTSFQIEVPGAEPMTVELFEVEELNYSSRLEQFSVLFRGPKNPYLPQAIYSLEHPKLGKFPLFIVPIGPDEQGMCYQAVFNRQRREQKNPA